MPASLFSSPAAVCSRGFCLGFAELGRATNRWLVVLAALSWSAASASSAQAELAVGLECHPVTFSHEGLGADVVPLVTASEGCEDGFYVAGDRVEVEAHPSSSAVVSSWIGTLDDASRSTSNEFEVPNGEHTVSVIYEEALFVSDFENGYFGAWDSVSGPLVADDFEDSDSSDWTFFTEGWFEEEGVFRSTNIDMGTPVAALWTTSESWTNYSVEVDVYVENPATASSSGLIFRFEEEFPSADRCQCTLGIDGEGVREASLFCGETEILVKTPFEWQDATWYRLRATVVANTVTCEVVDEAPFLQGASDLVNPSGEVGLRSTHVEADFDNFEVNWLALPED